jgi:hypothetical protein
VRRSILERLEFDPTDNLVNSSDGVTERRAPATASDTAPCSGTITALTVDLADHPIIESAPTADPHKTAASVRPRLNYVRHGISRGRIARALFR